MPSEGGRAAASNPQLERLAAALCAAAGVALWAWLFGLRRQGFDVTDESFYLFWLAEPWRFPISLSQFGFVYHPLYHALGGDIGLLRGANLSITWVCGTIFAWQALATSQPGQGRANIGLLGVGLGASALLVFDSGLMTPSYNSLTLQSLLIAATGAIRLTGNDMTPGFGLRRSGWAMAMLAVGSAVVALAKLSSAALLAPVIAAYVLAGGPRTEWRARMGIIVVAAVASAAALLVLVGLFFAGGVGELFHRLQGGMAIAAELDDGHGLLAILRLDIPRLDRTGFAMIAGACGGTGLIAVMARHQAIRAPLVVVVAGAAMALCLAESVEPSSGPLRVDLYQRLVILAIPLIALAGSRGVPARRWSIAILCGSLPFVFAFGTNVHYWQFAGAAAIFWIVGALVLVTDWVLAPLLGATALILTAWLLALGVLHPYRQPGRLDLYSDQLEVTPQSMLHVNKAFTEQVAALRNDAAEAGFAPGTSVIDLSGQSPGLVYLLGGTAPGQPWLVGGYPGSNVSAGAILALAPCSELGTAWLIVESRGPRALLDDVPTTYGADVAKDFAIVTRWTTLAGYRDGTAPRPQTLLRPLRAPGTAEIDCLERRRARDHFARRGFFTRL